MSLLIGKLCAHRDGLRRSFRERRVLWDRFVDTDDLCRAHFWARSDVNHINFSSLQETLRRLGGQPALILETGTSAHGTDSTLLFDSYVRSFGGRCESCDIDPVAVDRTRMRVSNSTSVHLGDSVAFLKRLSDADLNDVRLIYLDSYDVDFTDPLPAAQHCLAEFRACESRLAPGTLVLIDDSPSNLEWFEAFSDEDRSKIHKAA